MKKLLLLVSFATILAVGCKKTNEEPGIPNGPRTEVPAELRGNWMYGNFSMTEYWSQDPASYLGNALEFAFAFTFNSDGTYTQYFTGSSVTSGVTTYQQSVTKGTVEIDPANKKIVTHAYSSHYKRLRNGIVEEERDLRKDEITSATSYTYTTGVEQSGTKALYLRLENTASPLTFLNKP
ncbi:hypothetical protein [Segetibacter koreensis]|uniref:hypothetical protein n=1 Tax=Segetibacter koreensis TaxID=398037 RepID=UPI00036045CF|nr:hypothetical protein [Segetibacter koreensis]